MAALLFSCSTLSAGSVRINGGNIQVSDEGNDVIINGVDMRDSNTIQNSNNYSNSSSYVSGDGYSMKIENKEGEIRLRDVLLKDVVIYQSGPDIYIQFKKK